MIPDLTDIARGRRIVAVAARDLSLLRKSERPPRGLFQRFLSRFLRR